MLKNVTGITYGFSTRAHCDMRKPENRLKFLRLVGLNSSRLVTPKQIHGNRVLVVNDQTVDRAHEADGLVFLKGSGNEI